LGHRAAIYCRVSTADQSCERQEFDLRAFAGRAGYDVVGIFKETGSGTKLDRAERKKVLALAQSRQIDAILVTELSRWGRSTLDLLNTLRELENWKVSVIAMNGMAFDLSSPYGRMLARFLSGIAATSGIGSASGSRGEFPCSDGRANAERGALRLEFTVKIGPKPVKGGTGASSTPYRRPR
jgi:hypothetical protein